MMVFDWVKAAEIIKTFNPYLVEACLENDFFWTGGTIFRSGKIIDNQYTYLASYKAKPQIIVNGEILDCYVMASERPDWDADTKWPEEARKILES
jgi:hypothetical protein